MAGFRQSIMLDETPDQSLDAPCKRQRIKTGVKTGIFKVKGQGETLKKTIASMPKIESKREYF